MASRPRASATSPLRAVAVHGGLTALFAVVAAQACQSPAGPVAPSPAGHASATPGSPDAAAAEGAGPEDASVDGEVDGGVAEVDLMAEAEFATDYNHAPWDATPPDDRGRVVIKVTVTYPQAYRKFEITEKGYVYAYYTTLNYGWWSRVKERAIEKFRRELAQANFCSVPTTKSVGKYDIEVDLPDLRCARRSAFKVKADDKDWAPVVKAWGSLFEFICLNLCPDWPLHEPY